ncbi:MAG: hypothetical protein QNJ54_26885 [Prochloraceae cyanobacterium]|nr:hypothetical protein [Prochloraceae cyanobacterium]
MVIYCWGRPPDPHRGFSTPSVVLPLHTQRHRGWQLIDLNNPCNSVIEGILSVLYQSDKNINLSH